MNKEVIIVGWLKCNAAERDGLLVEMKFTINRSTRETK
jgi:hypothetical protein